MQGVVAFDSGVMNFVEQSVGLVSDLLAKTEHDPGATILGDGGLDDGKIRSGQSDIVVLHTLPYAVVL